MFHTEITTSRSAVDAFEGGRGVILWVIQLDGGETEQDAHDYVWANAPDTLTTRTGKDYEFESISITKDDAGNGILNVEITYTQAKPTQISFSTGGGSEKIEFSRKTRKCFTVSGSSTSSFTPDFHQGINVGKDSIEGISIRTREAHFKITKSFALADVSSDYLDILDDFTCTVNSAAITIACAMGATASSTTSLSIATGTKAFTVTGLSTDFNFRVGDRVRAYSDADATKWMEGLVTAYSGSTLTLDVDDTSGSGTHADWNLAIGIFRTYPAGELLFEGHNSVFTPDERLEATLSFAVSKGIYPAADPDHPTDAEIETWISIGEIVVDDKQGWDYLWVYSAETQDATTKAKVVTPKAVYTEKVYERRDFTELGISI